MGRASFLQSSFLGGEWSPLMQGRIDLPKYRSAMNLCQNTIPIEEGASQRRSGTQFLAPTRSGEPAKVIGYAPKQNTPYLMEFTDNHLRFFQGWDLYLDPSPPLVVSISSDTPALVTVTPAVAWSTGDQGEFIFPSSAFPGATTGALQNRQFTLTVVSDTTFTIADSVTQDPIDGTGITLNGSAMPSFGRIRDLPSPLTDGAWKNCRWIPFTNSQNVDGGALITGQEPQYITAATPGPGTTVFNIAPLTFTDGPYLDPINGAVASIAVGTGTPTFRIIGGAEWGPTSGILGRYNTGDVVMYGGFCYISTTGGTGGTNVDNVPGTNSAWVLVDPTAPDPAPAYWPAWSSGGSYTIWNGSGGGSIVSHNGLLWAAVNRGTHSFNGADEPGVNTGLTASWVEVAYVQVSDNISGIVTFNLTFEVWSNVTTYAVGDTASFGTGNYVSLTNGNLNNEPDSSPDEWATANAGLPFGPNGAQPTDVGRLMRFFYQPGEWVSTTEYNPGQFVTWNGAYYSALISNSGAQPDLNLTDWAPVANVAFWTNGIVVGVGSSTMIQVQLTGAPLTDTTPITIYEVGVYTNTGEQWPTCGCFYQGRLWLAGAVPNRIDSSTAGDPLTWTPTGPDGTVADDNGISFVLNSEDSELVQWMRGTQQGILVGTLTREWLINSSATNDPITPATVEISPITHYGSAFVEPKVTGLATVFVQKFQRQLMEMVANVFSGKYNAPNLALAARHLTANGIEEITYQEELAPVIWARMGDGSLSGCTYRRLSAIQTDNPVLLNEPSTFAAWHRHVLGTGRNVTSVTTTLIPDGTLDQLAMVTQGTTGTQTSEPAHPQVWIKVDDEDWNNTLGASPFTGVGGVSMAGMTGPFYVTAAFDGAAPISATYTGGFGETFGVTLANGSVDLGATPIVYENAKISAGGESGPGWGISAAPIATTPNLLQQFTINLAAAGQNCWIGISTLAADLTTLPGAQPSDWTDMVVASNNGDLVTNGTIVSTGITITDTSVIQIAVLYPTAASFESWVEVMQPLDDVNATLLDSWYLDGAVTPASQTLADTDTELVLYGMNHMAGETATVWAAGLDCGDFTVASDGSVTVPIGAANGLLTLTLVESFSGSVPAVVGTCFTTQGQIVRAATPQESGSQTGPAQGETRRTHMMNALLFNTQGISFGTVFDHLYPAQFADYVGGPIYPVTQLFSGVWWTTLEDTYTFDGMICWQVTRPYPATVVNIGGWVQTSER